MIAYSLSLTVLALTTGFIMSWAVGANDVANAMGTSVGSKVLSIKQAIVVAAIFEGLGAVLASSQVTNTIRFGLIDLHAYIPYPELLVYGMLAALLASSTWLMFATYYGWPVSTTHSIIGAVIGFNTVVMGIHSTQWLTVGHIFMSWMLTPIIAAVIAFILFKSVKHLILEHIEPIERSRQIIPFYIFITCFTVTFVTIKNVVNMFSVAASAWQVTLLILCISAILTIIGIVLMKKKYRKTSANQYDLTERTFGVLTLFTACSVAFAHGSNDVANAIGPLDIILNTIKSGHVIISASKTATWIVLFGGSGVIIGLAMYGYKVIETVGSNITFLTPSRGFAAQLATASTVIFCSIIGLPVSTTQILVGAILGVGLARGIDALNLGVIRNIFMSWLVTLPAGALLAIMYYYMIKSIMHHIIG